MNTGVLQLGVLGIGSPHGDDQIGWLLLDALAETAIAEKISLEKIAAPALSLFNTLQSYARIVLVDAVHSGGDLGEVRYIADAASVLQAQPVQISSHQLHLADAWQLLVQLGLPLPRISLFLIEIGQAEPLAAVSDKLLLQMPQLLASLEQVIREVETAEVQQEVQQDV